MARRRRRAGLRRLLLSIALASSAAYGACWAVWTSNRLSDERNEAKAGVSRSATRAAEAMAGFINTLPAVAEIAQSLSPDVLAGPGCSVTLPQAWTTADDGRPIGRFDLVRSDGTVVCTTAAADPARPNHHDRGAPWLGPDYEPGTRTSNYRDPSSGRQVWALAVPVGTPPMTGFVAAVTELAPASGELQKLFEDGTGTEFLVWDLTSGVVLSRPEGSDWSPRDPSGHIVATAKVPTSSWQLAAGVDRSIADTQVWGELRGAVLAFAAALAALALAATLVHRRIVRPLGAITEAARRTSEGGTTSLPEEGPAELAELASALNDLTASRDRSEAQLKVAAEEMGHSLERLDVVLANSADMVLIVDDTGRITFASRAVAAACGPAARPGAAFTSLVHPEDTAAAAALIRPGSSVGDGPVELRMGDGNGAWRHVEIVARDLRSHQAVGGVVLNGRDVTERRAEEAQRAALDEQFHQSQRLESLGALAGGIAHDFKNLLSVILWTADLAGPDAAGQPDATVLAEIRAAASRGVELAQQLLTFACHDDAEPEPLDVSDQLLGLAGLLRRTLGEHVELDFKVAAGLPAVRLNRSRFDQAIVNLAVNARDAMEGGGRLVVEAEEVEVEADPDLEPGTYVAVSVSDTGVGMAPEVAARALEPFFTTKGAGQGTGLGLAIVHGIVTAANGRVRLRSSPDEGTTVRLLLPASRDPSTGDGPPAGRSPARGAGEVVLVVEDHDALRALVQRMLRAGNYVALGAAGADQALACAADADQRLDLVLTDLLMPGLSGAGLTTRLAVLRPDLPVIYMSAYTADLLDTGRQDGGGPVVLEKPFSQDQLLTAVRNALARAGTATGR